MPRSTVVRFAYRFNMLKRYGSAQALFRDLDELGAVLGMTPELLARLGPYLSLYVTGAPAQARAALRGTRSPSRSGPIFWRPKSSLVSEPADMGIGTADRAVRSTQPTVVVETASKCARVDDYARRVGRANA